MESLSFKPGAYVNIPTTNSMSMSQLNHKVSEYSQLVSTLEPSKADTQIIDLDGDNQGMTEYSSCSQDRFQASLHKNVTPIY